MWIVLWERFDGYEVYGPFPSDEEAEQWRTANLTECDSCSLRVMSGQEFHGEDRD